jgi:hypothetical protein
MWLSGASHQINVFQFTSQCASTVFANLESIKFSYRR